MSAPTIKAIETVYRGYRFRSRLEARWAVFFDSIGMPYEYEAEGFDLDGRWYLPDFRLGSGAPFWTEIKPRSAAESLVEFTLALDPIKRLSEAFGSGAALLGTPWPGEYEGIYLRDGRAQRHLQWAHCFGCSSVGLVVPTDRTCTGCGGINHFGRDSRLLMGAYEASRSARFGGRV